MSHNKGKMQEKIDIAKKLLDSRVDKNIILNTTGLTKHQLENL